MEKTVFGLDKGFKGFGQDSKVFWNKTFMVSKQVSKDGFPEFLILGK
jgi:hypothetical protein